MRDVYLLERIVSGETSPDNFPERYRVQVNGFRGDPNRMDAFRVLQSANPSAAYRSVVEWVTQIGEQIRDRTAHPHWTTCTDTLEALSQYVSTDQSSHPDFLGKVIPALEEMAKQRGLEFSDHHNYQFTALNLLGELARTGTYVDEAQSSLQNVRDNTDVSLSKRVLARNILAHYEGFEDFWNTYASDVDSLMRREAKEIQVFGRYVPKYVFVADFFKGLEEEDVQNLCFVAGVTAYNEKKNTRPTNLKEGEDMTRLSESEIIDKIRFVAWEGLHILEREIQTGTIYNHSWDDAARISNADPERLKQRYQTAIEQMRKLEV